MLMKENINNALCQQASVEMENAMKYSILATYLEGLQLVDLAKIMYEQSKEEFEHYQKIIKYLNDRTGAKYITMDIEKPEFEVNTINDVGRLYLETELATTEALEVIADLIYAEKSYIDVNFIQEMLGYQITEEKEAIEFKQQIEMTREYAIYNKVV